MFASCVTQETQESYTSRTTSTMSLGWYALLLNTLSEEHSKPLLRQALDRFFVTGLPVRSLRLRERQFLPEPFVANAQIGVCAHVCSFISSSRSSIMTSSNSMMIK